MQLAFSQTVYHLISLSGFVFGTGELKKLQFIDFLSVFFPKKKQKIKKYTIVKNILNILMVSASSLYKICSITQKILIRKWFYLRITLRRKLTLRVLEYPLHTLMIFKKINGFLHIIFIFKHIKLFCHLYSKVHISICSCCHYSLVIDNIYILGVRTIQIR